MILDDLRNDGFAKVPPISSIRSIVEHLEGCTRHPGHVKVYPNEQNAFCYDMGDVLRAPGFLKYAVSYAEIMSMYLDVPMPRLYSVNAFWTMPDPVGVPSVTTWHADSDDVNFAAMFVYGTDVLDESDGAHRFTMRDGRVRTVLGEAGTAFIEDPRQQHMGLVPTRRPRLLLWARWGVTDPPPSYAWDRLSPVDKDSVPDYPATPWLQKCVELVVR